LCQRRRPRVLAGVRARLHVVDGGLSGENSGRRRQACRGDRPATRPRASAPRRRCSSAPTRAITNEGSESLVRGRDDDDEEDDNPSEMEARLSEREWLAQGDASNGLAAIIEGVQQLGAAAPSMSRRPSRDTTSSSCSRWRPERRAPLRVRARVAAALRRWAGPSTGRVRHPLAPPRPRARTQG
jgi:hypothetical protein